MSTRAAGPEPPTPGATVVVHDLHLSLVGRPTATIEPTMQAFSQAVDFQEA